MWETQRAGWSIKDVICERAYWDEYREKPIDYAVGEFERLYSDQTSFELFYENGISTFELSTLPALIYHLATKHPGANVRLRTIEETGGGAKIKISVGDVPPETVEKVKEDAERAHQAQKGFRGNDPEISELRTLLRASEKAFDKLLDKLVDSGRRAITVMGNVQGAIQTGHYARADFSRAVINDNSELIELIDRLLSRSTELSLSRSDERSLYAAAESVKTELQKKNLDKSALLSSLDFLKRLLTEAVTRSAGKLGERVASTDWQALIHKLTQSIHHLG